MCRKVLFLAVVCFSLVACGKTNPATDFEYTENENAITITAYKGETKDVVIPAKINKLPVKAIGEDAFTHKELTSIAIPDSVVAIAGNAFSNNQLMSVKFSNNLSYIGENAFSENDITSVVIPNSVETIGVNAFDKDVSLEGKSEAVETYAVISANQNVESPYSINDVRKSISSYGNFKVSIKIYKRDNENQKWFDRQKQITQLLVKSKKENAFNVAIEGKKNQPGIISLSFGWEYWFNNTFYYEPKDSVVSVECSIVSIDTGVFYMPPNFVQYARQSFIDKQTNVDEPTGKYRHIQYENTEYARNAFPVFQAMYNVSSNPDITNSGIFNQLVNK